MRIFQTCFFIIEIIFYLILGLIIALDFNLFFNTKKRTTKGKLEYIHLENISERKRLKVRNVSPWKVIWFVIVMGITIYFIKPYFLDIPQLVTGKLNYVTGKVQETKHYSKDPIEYVFLSTGEEVEFFFSSGVSKNNFYKIGYLTHTKRAIYCGQFSITSSNNKVVGFPFKDILGFLAILGAIFFLIFISPYVKWKLFIPVNIISIPTFIYYFIKYRVDNGIWFSVKNNGFLGLMFCLVFILLTFFMHFIEKRRSDDFYRTYVFAQLFSICELGFLICLVFNLD
ncbi:hypothetical protein [Clostridium sp. JN-9]|uniref:hypothetical protein n=1 Tax=Clostridium sp. JN-9 TaxID=2507159 RepID=UPI000FFE1B71|nr:hypothetical protein [Clostridium sp. JN-9]QAT39859.1 hypothetical protein EQM05_06125 [Clostridium sp. JN-9]